MAGCKSPFRLPRVKDYEIRESKGIKKHLAELEKEKILTKTRTLCNVWNINPDQEIFKQLAEDFLGPENNFDFINSKICSSNANQ